MFVTVRSTVQEGLDTRVDGFPLNLDTAAKERDADQIMSICRHYSFRELEETTCLYLGECDSVIIECLARNFKQLIALDFDRANSDAIGFQSGQSNIKFISYDGTGLHMDDSVVDVIICDRFYDCVQNPHELMSEIYRVMRYDGFCYFSAYNKLSLVERHYSLPFLSWLPRRMAESYMRIFGKEGRYDFRLLTLSKLKLLTDNFWRHDYIGLIRQSPSTFTANNDIQPRGLRAWFPRRILKYIYPFLPLYIWILTKKK